MSSLWAVSSSSLIRPTSEILIMEFEASMGLQSLVKRDEEKAKCSGQGQRTCDCQP